MDPCPTSAYHAISLECEQGQLTIAVVCGREEWGCLERNPPIGGVDIARLDSRETVARQLDTATLRDTRP